MQDNIWLNHNTVDQKSSNNYDETYLFINIYHRRRYHVQCALIGPNKDLFLIFDFKSVDISVII